MKMKKKKIKSAANLPSSFQSENLWKISVWNFFFPHFVVVGILPIKHWCLFIGEAVNFIYTYTFYFLYSYPKLFAFESIILIDFTFSELRNEWTQKIKLKHHELKQYPVIWYQSNLSTLEHLYSFIILIYYKQIINYWN